MSNLLMVVFFWNSSSSKATAVAMGNSRSEFVVCLSFFIFRGGPCSLSKDLLIRPARIDLILPSSSSSLSSLLIIASSSFSSSFSSSLSSAVILFPNEVATMFISPRFSWLLMLFRRSTKSALSFNEIRSEQIVGVAVVVLADNIWWTPSVEFSLLVPALPLPLSLPFSLAPSSLALELEFTTPVVLLRSSPFLFIFLLSRGFWSSRVVV
mmetsp:Transcript_24541/g.53752  ORF Transcript_24541/g.53752 Transcript_24541/m.53752 type:complete len:210 (+) Transcript_24541:3414-4043(+)